MPQAFPITASTIDVLPNTPNAAHHGTGNVMLQIDGLSENGVPIAIGPNSDFGLHLEPAVISVYGRGTVEPVFDPTTNDGTPGATWGPATQSGSAGFSNPPNTPDDSVLATGSSVSRRHPHAALGAMPRRNRLFVKKGEAT